MVNNGYTKYKNSCKKFKQLIKSFIIICSLCSSTISLAQQTQDTVPVCKIKDFPDLFRKKDSVHLAKPPKSNFLILIPLIASQPATGFLYGAIGQYTFKPKQEGARYSSATISGSYTTKHQLLINAKNNLVLNENKLYFAGDWRFYIFSQDNYGLGSDIIPPPYRDHDFDLESLAEPMTYKYFKFHQTLSYGFFNDFYIGGGIHLDGYSDINDSYLDIAKGQYTAHYLYSQKHGYNDTKYYVDGLSFNLVYDSRDNQVNANHGWYGNINYRVNPSFMNNQATSTVLYTEYNYYLPLSKRNLQHVLAFWAYGQFLISGDLPYLNLPSIGWDPSSRGGKGYTQGLFRGQNIAYFESEYRFPITCNQLISGTVFANFTSTSDKDRDIRIFQYIQPSCGVGLRILIDKASRTNFVFNYAWGRHSKAFYLNAGETF
ncbi:BamA/TamA family outer membrane protein [Flavobacterium sp.]|uniref:BamA/TamA family outer membrane protein n=1 Tax=Flavobacterium sp. TaxID=239 RepID=UPI002C704DAF|nr:BamA/TamA family outer membrane protein [Flavobacterium sp.]HSD09138.1 BamA/TamA family outer membrane protein [Flavobacterium sp.]